MDWMTLTSGPEISPTKFWFAWGCSWEAQPKFGENKLKALDKNNQETVFSANRKVEKDLGVAAYNIDKKRLELESLVDSSQNVVAYFSCTCAMESSVLREEFKKRRDSAGNDSDREFE